MINFTKEEIFLSIMHAAILGASFSILKRIFTSVLGLVKSIRKIIIDCFIYEKIKKFPNTYIDSIRTENAFLIFIATFLFSIAFMLLSYYSLDGQIRLYMLAVVFASFYLCEITFSRILSFVLYGLINKTIIVFIFVSRLFLYPLAKIIPQKAFKSLYK